MIPANAVAVEEKLSTQGGMKFETWFFTQPANPQVKAIDSCTGILSMQLVQLLTDMFRQRRKNGLKLEWTYYPESKKVIIDCKSANRDFLSDLREQVLPLCQTWQWQVAEITLSAGEGRIDFKYSGMEKSPVTITGPINQAVIDKLISTFLSCEDRHNLSLDSDDLKNGYCFTCICDSQASALAIFTEVSIAMFSANEQK